jgi:hypothetical protein
VYTQLNGLAGAGALAFTPSANNTVTLTYIDAAGWSAEATNPAVTSAASDVCGVYVGVAANAPNAAVKAEGAPACY